MKCEQARLLLTANRELNHEHIDTTELDVHLERCESCRQFLARLSFIGRSLRALPEIEPPPEMHAQLMRRLASEHLHFTQKAAPGSVTTPDFLKPYLQEPAPSARSPQPIRVLSTADTGPLPIIHTRRQSRLGVRHGRRTPLNQFAILGLAAAFLMLLMMGGITSLVILAQHNAQQFASVTRRSGDIVQHVDINPTQYTTTTSFPHLASVIADSTSIYYTAYSDDNPSQWMLLQMSRDGQVSSSLLASPGEQPMIVLGSSPDWLVWLQYGKPQTVVSRSTSSGHVQTILTPWSLYALSLAQLQLDQQVGTLPTPQLLLKGSFNVASAPNWVHNPVQGIWLMQDRLLIASLDANGTSHLYSSQLDLSGKSTLTTLATATAGHIFTSPTADSTGTLIFWADEWISSSGNLSSNIWQQQEINAPGAVQPTHGRWSNALPQTTQQQLFLSNGYAFHPQVADDMLFWMNAAPPTAPSGTPTSTPVATTTLLVPRIDTAFFAPALDATERGEVMMQPVAGDELTPPVALTSAGQAYALQIGTDFALWQTDKGYQMYDVPAQDNVTVGSDLNDASLLAVNENTTVWLKTTPDTGISTSTGTLTPSVHLFAFNWPK